jgi:hypothetical protein
VDNWQCIIQFVRFVVPLKRLNSVSLDGVATPVVGAKEKYNYGPAKMKLHLRDQEHVDVSTTAIYRFMKKKRLIRNPFLSTSTRSVEGVI